MAGGEAKTRRNILIVAAVLGLATSVLIHLYLRNTRTASEQQTTWLAVVATRDISARTIIGSDMIEEQHLTKLEAPEEVVTSEIDLIGKVALEDIEKGEPVRVAKIAAKGVSLGLSFTIPRAMRAVTVGVDEVVGVAGFLKPGDCVDVVASYQLDRAYVSRTVVQDVRLLALGSQLENERMDEDGRKPGLSGKGTATLLVTPGQAESLVLAENRGKLRLTLRSVGDHTRAMTSGARIATGSQQAKAVVSSSPRPAPMVRQAAPYPFPVKPGAFTQVAETPTLPAMFRVSDNRPQVEVIRGAEVETVRVDHYK